MNVLMFLDGVLRKADDKSPIQQGVRLFKSLADKFTVIVLADDKVEAERWFRQNAMIQKLDDIVDYKAAGELDPKFRQVDYCRSNNAVDFVVTDDVDLSFKLLEQGVTTYLFLHPKYMRPEFRPDGRKGGKSWEAIIEELDRQQELYSEDPRV